MRATQCLDQNYKLPTLICFPFCWALVELLLAPVNVFEIYLVISSHTNVSEKTNSFSSIQNKKRFILTAEFFNHFYNKIRNVIGIHFYHAKGYLLSNPADMKQNVLCHLSKQLNVVSTHHVLVLFSHKCNTPFAINAVGCEYISWHVNIRRKSSFLDTVVYEIVWFRESHKKLTLYFFKMCTFSFGQNEWNDLYTLFHV